jgi:hypothetical protein
MPDLRYFEDISMSDWKAAANPLFITCFWLLVFSFTSCYYQKGEEARASRESLRSTVQNLQEEVKDLKSKLDGSSEVLSNVLRTSYNIGNAYFEQETRLKNLKAELGSNLFAVEMNHVKAPVAEHLQNLRGRIMYLEAQLDA